MSVPTASADTGRASLVDRATSLARNAPQRLRERPFWIIQAGVFAVTGLHLLGELWAAGMITAVHPALHHVPVILYLAPIAYASLRYGIEGAYLTGVWCALLTLPNIFIFHARNLEWLTELVYVGVVIAAGVIMAVPVERERRMRQRAEATSHRLALLNEIATLTLTGDLRRTLDETLASLVGVLGLDAACVAATDPDDPARMTFLARYPSREGSLETCLAHVDPLVDTGHVRPGGDNVLVVAFDTDLPDPSPAGRVTGLLGVQVNPALQPGPDDHRLLVGVANQLATALANDRLRTLERDRVRSYARLVTWAQEEERKRISRELHDEAAQNLVAIRRDLDALGSPAADGAGLEELRALASRTLAGLRRFSRDLRPPVLDDLGVRSALDALVADIGQQDGPTARLTVEGASRRLAGDRELMLFRIGQAALNNVLRHASARSVSVELAFLPDRVRLTVIDDGVGFDPPDDPAELAAGGKLGLLGMRERAELASAELTIVSARGEGTRITVEIAD